MDSCGLLRTRSGWARTGPMPAICFKKTRRRSRSAAGRTRGNFRPRLIATLAPSHGSFAIRPWAKSHRENPRSAEVRRLIDAGESAEARWLSRNSMRMERVRSSTCVPALANLSKLARSPSYARTVCGDRSLVARSQRRYPQRAWLSCNLPPQVSRGYKKLACLSEGKASSSTYGGSPAVALTGANCRWQLASGDIKAPALRGLSDAAEWSRTITGVSTHKALNLAIGGVFISVRLSQAS